VRRLLSGDYDTDAKPVDLSCESAARPTLETAYRLWAARGAPSDGILTTKVIDAIGEEHEERSIRVISLLVQDDYLAPVSELGTQYGPTAVTVTARGATGGRRMAGDDGGSCCGIVARSSRAGD
jgi:hypothetical protein